MFGCSPGAAPLISVNFVSNLSITSGLFTAIVRKCKLMPDYLTGTMAEYNLKKRCMPVKGCRTVRKQDMKHNNSLPEITVDPETYKVTADGVHCTVAPATELPLTQNYM